MYSDIYTFKNHCFPFSTAVRQQPFSYLGGGLELKKKKKNNPDRNKFRMVVAVQPDY